MNKKNLIKKLNIFILIFSLMALTPSGFVLDSVQASSCASFNTHPLDKETLMMGNVTQGDTEWNNPISANPGDDIDFRVYYHNVPPGPTAYNTRIKLVFPNQNQSQIVTAAYLQADNSCETVTDAGTINVSASERLVFEDTACWYPNQGNTCQRIPVTKTLNSVEVNIGNIKPCWDYQGYVVFEATLTDTPQTPPAPTGVQCQTVSSSQINLSWNAADTATGYKVYRCTGSSCTPTTLVRTQPGTSWNNTGLLANTTYRYRVRAYNAAGDSPYSSIVTCTTHPTDLTVTCSASPNPAQVNQTVTFTAYPSGGTGTYSYSWTGACTCNSKSCSTSFSQPGTYTATVTVTSGSQTKSASCSVNVESPDPTVDLKANSSNGPITVSYKSNVVLSWTSENATFCQASGDWSGLKGTSGFQSIKMNEVKTHIFTLTCKDSSGTKEAVDSVTVHVTPNPPTVITLPAVVTH